jgi:DNA-directed RNA polymerase subunit beta
VVSPADIDYMDVSPSQLVSAAAALIPFLEHDDANRALMGSNMQRQAVPLLHTDAPLVGTGLEFKLARDSGAVITARRGGEVVRVTADEVIIDTGAEATGDLDQPLAKLAQYDRYVLKKFWRTNQDTAINQRPLVEQGQTVMPGEILADGPSTDNGELALGRNVLVAFMPYYGYNYEDAIVISEKLVKDDVFTSIHIQELELHVRDTKRGMEEITREIPNVSEESLVDLDERGIVRIGARVNSGDILVGKITPKGETELSPEEKLLTAIFGEKAKDVKDSSLRIPPGMNGTVIDVKIFSRRIDDPLLEKERGARIAELRQQERDEVQRITDARNEELGELLQRQTVALMLKKGTVEPYMDEGTKLNKTEIESINFSKVDLSTLKVQNKDASEKIRRLVDEAQRRTERVRERTEEQIDKVFQPDELPPGVVQLVKVYIAQKRKISVGDKMAGRHGNKGIIARIAPEEDMPFLPDGTPVEIVLNPLGVPSRMNVGQILETHLGWAARTLGFEAKTPVFQGATEDEIGALLKFAGLMWAQDALNLKEARLDLQPDDLRHAIAASHLLPEEGRLGSANGGGNGANGAGRVSAKGLGRDLDQFVDQKLPKDSKEVFDRIHGFVVAAAKEVAARQDKELGEVFPSVEAIARKRTAGSGLDAAISELMVQAGLFPNGKVWLRDGRSGRRFDFPITVGAIYMLKLSHLVDDKIHARSIGPYSLVTQQPLAGKAQFGGQRFGEMEVWALEAYGAAHTLQEILTVKSDDVQGRSKVYEAIVKGDNLPKPGIPESFNVLVKELQALGLSVTLGQED